MKAGKNLQDQIIWKAPEQLVPHPINSEVFDDLSEECKRLLLESVKEKGIFHPIVIANDEKTILSGHQRWMAAKELGLSAVPCRIANVPPDSDEATLIVLEANMAQRNLTPESYVKCLRVYEDIPSSIKNIESLQDKLIPELWEALKQGKLKVNLARAMARFLLEEQKNFISLIGVQIADAYKTKIEVLKKTLEETKLKLSMASTQLQKNKEYVAELEQDLAKANKDRMDIQAALEDERERKKRLLARIREKEEEIEKLKMEFSPEAKRQIEEKKAGTQGATG